MTTSLPKSSLVLHSEGMAIVEARCCTEGGWDWCWFPSALSGNRNRAEVLRWVNAFCRQRLFSYQLGWKSPGNINERSHFRCSFSHPLLPILNHMPEWPVLWECSIGPTDSFSYLKTKPKQVAPKLLFRNAFCVTHHSSWMEISFSISQSLAIFFVCYHSFIFSKLCTLLWYYSCEQLEGTKK